MVLLESLLATFIVSLISFIGIFTLAINKKILEKITNILIAFAAGGLLGGAFLHLIPEAIEKSNYAFLFVLLGFIFFFVLEKILKWRHCHKGECHVHTVSYMSLIGDGIHNFIDGLIIAAGFATNFSVGLTATAAVILHEIPQEIGDFAILVYGGFSRFKALIWNFLSGLTAVLGALVGFFINNATENFSAFLLPFAAGGFIYIAASDLVPELHKDAHGAKSILYLSLFVLGILLMFIFTFLE